MRDMLSRARRATTGSPAFVLFLLAPAVGELLSGHSPPSEFFSPLTLALQTLLYGGGAVLVREAAVRWGKGWGTILLLGLAYGIVEEGLMVKSFFDPAWGELGPLSGYGRWAGVNWVWGLHLVLFHAAFSIAIPILLVELIFSDRRSESWVSSRNLAITGILFAGVCAIGFLFMTPYRPPMTVYTAAAAVTIALILLARRLPVLRPVAATRSPARSIWFAVIGFVWTVGLFMLVWQLPTVGVPAAVTVALVVALTILCAWAIWRLSGRARAWSDAHRLALAAGALAFFILFAALQELEPPEPANTSGMAVVGAAGAVMIAWLACRVRRRDTAGRQPARSSTG
jgi:hypothetical protein